MLIDTHAHLNMDPLYQEWQTVLAEAVLHGVDALVIPGTDLESSNRAIEMAIVEPRILAAVGIHPENGGGDIDQLATIASLPQVGAIGEIGLDYFRIPRGRDPQELKEEQRQLFVAQLKLAHEFDLPALIHLRTEEAMLDAVSLIKTIYGSKLFRGIFHCFTGSMEFFNTISHWDVFIGIGGMITYSRQQELQQVIAQIPLDRMVLETDAPFLTPEPLSKGMNTPGNVTISACKLAQLKGVGLMEVLEITGENALRLFPQLNRI